MEDSNHLEYPKNYRKWKEIMRDAKVWGEEHVNHVANLVPKQVTGEDFK